MHQANVAHTTLSPIPSPLSAGDKHFRLTAVRDLGRRKRKRVWLFRCECGEEIEAQSALVRRGQTKSCGCYRREWARDRTLVHGEHRTPTYTSWQSMVERCRNPNATAYQDYGGRGIVVCERWLSFELFLQDMGERPAGTTLDRRNTDGNYEPGNCRWATPRQQARNKRNTIYVNLDGEAVCLADACDRLGLIYPTVYSRMRRGESFEEARRGQLAPDGRNLYKD